MIIEEDLQSVSTIAELRGVLIRHRVNTARSIDFNTLNREMYACKAQVREEFGEDDTELMNRFGRLEPGGMAMVEALNLTTMPALVLAVARAMRNAKSGRHA